MRVITANPRMQAAFDKIPPEAMQEILFGDPNNIQRPNNCPQCALPWDMPIFSWRERHWLVDDLKAALTALPRSLLSFPREAARGSGLLIDPGQVIPPGDEREIVEAHLAHIPEDRVNDPIITGAVWDWRVPHEPARWLLMDGSHRTTRRFRYDPNLQDIDCYVLTVPEVLICEGYDPLEAFGMILGALDRFQEWSAIERQVGGLTDTVIQLMKESYEQGAY